MKNPFLITLKDNSHVEIGDPFILRFNGVYYLYCSTCDDALGVRCFISYDLLNFEEYGLVAQGEILRHAYAPEVIYKDDEFIMCTSPRGNGHYFLKSKSPLGPFEFISDNINNMIDGSFVNDSNNNLHFIRADHNGIAYLDYVNNKLINRKDIVPQISKAWTEGPSITYFKGYYYLTYCGNDVLSENYRIKVASSKYLDKDYKVQASPLLLSTEKDYFALGHNSIVLGPSLDEYYVCYHTLERLENGTTRYLCLDRLYINNQDLACNYSNFEIPNPKRPDFECDVSINNKLEKIDSFLLSKDTTLDYFSSEFNFKEETSIILSYVDSLNYVLFNFKDNSIRVIEIKEGQEELIFTKKVNFNFNHFHCIRIINDKYLELLIDNIPLFKIKRVNKGKIGYLYKDNNLFYTAYTNSTYLNSLKEVPFVLPGKIEANYLSKKIKKTNSDVQYISLKKNEKEIIKITSSEKRKYRIYAKMKNKDASVLLESSLDTSNNKIVKNENAYEFSIKYLGELLIDKDDEVKLIVLKGSLDFEYLLFKPVLDTVEFNLNLLNKDNRYIFNNFYRTQTLTFRLNRHKEDNVYGLIVNAENYCNFRSVRDIKYHGYFVGFDNGLLVVDYCQYDRVRIYDKPYRLKERKVYKLKVEFLDNIIKVYINDKLEIITDLKYDTCYGYTGIYINKYSRISILDYKGED